MFKKLAKRLRDDNKQIFNVYATSPVIKEIFPRKNEFLNKLARKALNMYERENDVQKFVQLAMSNPENTSHNDTVAKLFAQGVQDPFLEEKLEALADNRKFLRDLGLL